MLLRTTEGTSNSGGLGFLVHNKAHSENLTRHLKNISRDVDSGIERPTTIYCLLFTDRAVNL